MPLQPTELPNRLFQFITMDFVTDLPESEGYDAILVVVDQFTKTIIIEPCNKTINADITANLLLKRVFCKFGIPDKIISDRGPQFASKVMKTVLKSMGIRSALSTAFHPQTNGATERTNQEIEQFL
jgi:transposase InsO family protein